MLPNTNKKNFMKKQIALIAITAFALTLTFVACKKEASNGDSTSTEITKHSDDQSQFSGEVDAASNDAAFSVETSASLTGRGQGIQSVCNGTVVIDSISNPRTITITYNGLNCLGTATRTGAIVVSMAQGIRWKDAGAAVTVSYQNYKITRVSDGKSITINGSETYTNVSGGLLYQLASLQSITHTITSSGLTVTFDNGTQRSWQVAKQRVFTYNNGVVITSSGTHTDGAVTNIAEWGTNRFGNAFTTSTTAPLVIRQDCNFRLVSGEVRHVTPNVTATVTFGLDSSGNPVTCPSGSFYFKLMWTGPNGGSGTVILPY
jgi:hypothetical protein